jgi:hypothetical protein
VVAVYTSDNPEAVWPGVTTHPSWSLAATETLHLRSSKIAQIEFPEPRHARYVRLDVRLVSTENSSPKGTHARFVLGRLTLLRSRDFWIQTEPHEDLRVDLVLVRLMGEDLTEDYGFIDGRSGLSLTLEARQGKGPFQTLKSARTLLDLFENNQIRPFANARISERRKQTFTEHVTATQSGSQDSDTTTITDNNGTIIPGHTNITVTRSGSYNMHGSEAQTMLMQLGGTPVGQFAPPVADRIKTVREFGDSPSIPNPFGQDPISTINDVLQYAAAIDQSGRPASIGLGVNTSLGGAAGITFSGGSSFSVSTQVGGGSTLSRVSGDQASGTLTQSEIAFQETNQRVVSMSKSQSTRQGTSDETRTIERTDHSEEQRGRSLAVKYGGVYEDILLVTWPVQRQLTAAGNGDAIRVRVDHLPPGVRIDVEFRCVAIPLAETGS